MFKKLLSKFAESNISVKIAAAVIIAAAILAAALFGFSSYSNEPDAQDPQNNPQQEVQPEQQPDDDIIDIEDIEDVEDIQDIEDTEDENTGIKDVISNIIDSFTGKDKDENENENKDDDDKDSPSNDNDFVIRYIVNFETNGGGEIGRKSVVKDTAINRLPTPNREGHIFLGWYYDEALTDIVEGDDVVDKNMTLYASYLEQAPLETLERVNFASAENVGKDFTIKVITADDSLTADDVKAAIIPKNLTNPAVTDFIEVTEEDGGFVISGVKYSEGMGTSKGFEEGATYSIKLNSDALFFEGYPESAREFNFTTYKEEVLNLKLNGDIIYIPAENLKNIINNGKAVSTLNIALYTVGNDGAASVASLTEGSFEYDKELAVGQIVSVYEGLIPTERTLETPEEQLGDIGYVEITGKSGNKYSYKNAQPEEVIFTPDMLPVPVDADKDSNEGTITVEDKYFDYSADFYSEMELDSQTKVDIGDFLVFYSGDLMAATEENSAERKGFGEITAVTKNNDGTTTVAYNEVGWDYVDSSMDVYTQDEITAEELLDGINKEEIEAEIEQQAIDSGFAEEAAQYLASLSLATDNFSKLSDNMNLEDYKVVLEDGTPVTPEELQLMGNGISARVADTKVKASVSAKPKHLGNIPGTDADKEGLAISLEVTSVISIESADGDGELEITVTGKFIEEIGFDYGASSDTEWDWAVIIPYIKEWTVSANLDLVNYTGLEISAVMITKESDDDTFGDAIDIAEEIKELLASNTNPETGDDHHTKLIEKYSEIVHADSDWIKLVEINIFEFSKRLPPALPIIHLEVSVDFVIQMDASISVGFEFEYMEGKRYVFNVRITEGEVTSDTISLKEKTYELNFYTMGRIALRAGVEMEFKVGLFDTKIANIGFDAGAGPYTKLYGYFYYELRYTESQGRSQKYSGALLTEVGVYFNLGLNAEAIGGKFSSSVDLIDKEWLLWQAGRRDNVLDFDLAQEDMPEITMRQYVRRTQLPDTVFNMDYLDLITGDGKNAIYNDWNDPEKEGDFRNGENYVITMTNDKFSYDPKTNEICVEAEEGETKIQGEMIITWKKQPMSFSSKPIQRRITLYWDNLRDGYMIVPYTNGGTYIPIIVKGFEQKVTAPEDPEKLGYIFTGWYSDDALTVPYTFPELMPDEDTNIYAGWEAATDIPYTVEHYLENLQSGEYEFFEAENFEGTTDTLVTPAVKTYEGYDSPAEQEIKVQADGSSILRYYYKLKRNTVTFNSGLEGKENSSYSLKYGAKITAPQMTAKGYTFTGWTIDGVPATPASKMGEEPLSYTATWKKNDDTEYRVEYYIQQTDGSYKLQHLITKTAATDAILNEADLRAEIINGIPADEKYTDIGIKASNMTVKGIVCDQATVTGNGKLVVKINYARNLSDVTFDPAYEGAAPVVKPAYYQQVVEKPADPSRIGYTFAGWDDLGTEAIEAVEPISVMIEKPITYNALWTPNPDTAYTVKHYQQNVDDLDAYTIKDTDNLNGTTASDVTPDVKVYEGFTSPDVKTATIKADGSMVVEYFYDRIEYAVTLEANGGTFGSENDTDDGNEIIPDESTEGEEPGEEIVPDEGTEGEEPEPGENEIIDEITVVFLYGESLVLPEPVRAGYGLSGWNNDGVPFLDGTMPARDLVLTAQWEAGKIGYTVNHYHQNVDGSDNYTLASFENLTADMDSDVTPMVNTYTGFTSPEQTTITIQADSKLNIIDYYYSRNKYTLTWDFNGGSAEDYTSGEVYYNAPITVPVPVKKGYSYIWDDLSTEEIEAVDPITVMDIQPESYKAIWTANDYQISFDLKGGTVVTPEGETPVSTDTRTVTYDTAYGELATLEKVGYIFDGWYTADGTKVTSETILSIDENHTLHAKYILITHDISYKFIDFRTGEELKDVSNDDNPAYYSVEAHEFILTAAEKAGYAFRGWYLDSSFTDGTKIEGEIDFADDVYSGQTFYAKFEPHKYTIEFYQGTENESPITHELYYGEGLSLSEYSDYIKDNKAGYNLIGWSTKADDKTAEYSKDGVVSSLTTEDLGTAKLYAVWEAKVYTIKYNMGMHTTETGSSYVKEYTVETPADITLPKPKPKNNFAFGGWYTDASYKNPISVINVKEAKTNYTLYAKWEHAGEFSISYTSKSDGKAIFTITRTIPSGAVASQAVQTIYVRTLNGTAYATTPEVAGGYGQDKYHFVHNQEAIAFGSGKTSATFTVTENDDYLSDYVTASYQIGGRKRNYYAEIYKVVSSQGGLSGIIEDGRAMRTMSASGYTLTTDMYTWYSKSVDSETRTVTDGGYGSNKSYTVDLSTVTGGSTTQQKYRNIVSNQLYYYIKFELKENDDGYQWVQLSNGSTRVAEYHFATKDGEEASNWGRTIELPNGGTGAQGDILFNVGDCLVYESSSISGETVVANKNTKVKIEFDAGGKDDDDWQHRNLYIYAKTRDVSEPAKQYVAPIALTEYKAGDKVMLTIIYNEPIDSISGTPSLSLSSRLSTYFKDPAYVYNSAGTNAIVFEVTVKKDFSANEAMKINEYLAFPESSYKNDGFGTNIGSVYASVWDILGN